MRSGLLPTRPIRVEAISIGEIDVKPSILVVVEKGSAAPLGFDNDSLVVDAAPYIGNCQTGLLGHIHKLHCGLRSILLRCFQDQRGPPFPDWSGKRFSKGAAEYEEGGAEESSPRIIHKLG